MTTALGVDRDADGKGLDPLSHRLLIMSEWENTGIVSGLTVTGTTGLKYQVAAGSAVTSMGDADGYAHGYWGGGQTEHAVDAGDASYARIDTIYMLCNTGDPDNLVHVDVAQGTPSASPVEPDLPTGAQKLFSRQMPAGASNTNASIAFDTGAYAISRDGRLVFPYASETVEGPVPNDNQSPFLSLQVTLPTDRWLNVHTFLCVSTHGKQGLVGVATVRFLIDGVLYTSRKVEYDENYLTYEPTTRMNLTAGTHTISLVMFKQQGDDFEAHFGTVDGDNYPGRVLRIDDGGVAQ